MRNDYRTWWRKDMDKVWLRYKGIFEAWIKLKYDIDFVERINMENDSNTLDVVMEQLWAEHFILK